MNVSPLVQPHHLARRAAIYIRQSTGHQVLTNLESRRLQEAMREHAHRLGWSDERIELVDADTGRSGATAAGRDAYRDLLSDVALGNVGVVLSYDSARLSRNCSDWYPLLDFCALKGCLVADRDGVYDPSSVNGRLLLGMKGILSEIELHTMRGRLTAGLHAKARRGELAMTLPAGYTRDDLGRAVKDPDVQVQEAISLVFATFVRQRSAYRVAVEFRRASLRVPRRWRSSEVTWDTPTTPKILSILKNPVYAGVYAYGRRRWKPEIDEDGRRRPRYRSPEEWKVDLRDHHPAYVSWETFQQIQAILKENYAEYTRRMSKGSPRRGEALLQGIAYCGKCGRKLRVDYTHDLRYVCSTRQAAEAGPDCQGFCGAPVDAAVADAFLRALAPVEVDLYERAVATRREADAAVDKAQDRELQRLRYETDLARRRYERIDPDNRLVAGELERRWEVALQALNDAQRRFADARADRDRVVPFAVPKELREAFSALGESVPRAWQGGLLDNSQRKALLRCLVDKVVVTRERERPDQLATRVVWRGGAVTEMAITVRVTRMHEIGNFAALEAQALALAAERKTDGEIAQILTERGFRSARTDRVVPSMIETIRRRHHLLHVSRGQQPRHVDGRLTVRELAARLGTTEDWIYTAIKRGQIAVERDAGTNLYLFSDNPETIAAIQRLRTREVRHVDVE